MASVQGDDRPRRAGNCGAVPAAGGRDEARMPATNAKPRDQFAGLRGLATFRGPISSRHRDVCRPVVTGLEVGISEVSSIGLPSINEYRHVASSRNHRKPRAAQTPLVDALLEGSSRRIGDQMQANRASDEWTAVSARPQPVTSAVGSRRAMSGPGLPSRGGLSSALTLACVPSLLPA